MADLGDEKLARLRAMVADATFSAKFELRQQIGAGGMGRVFAARERAGDRQVAIKLLDVQLFGEHARFAAEAELLETLDHPAIVSYIAHGITADGTPYLAMEWLDGEPLSRVLQRGPLALTAALDVAIRIADALAYLHARGVVHRDIKPSNVVLVDGAPAQAKVIDLGIAKDLGAATRLTGTGQMIGTPGYMAPEQMMGTAIDARVDLFSLGCLLYEAVAGVAPFHGTAVVEVLARVLLETPPPIARADVPTRLVGLIDALMAKRADARAPSASSVADELRVIRDALDRKDAPVLAAASPFAAPELAETVRERGLGRPVAVPRARRWWLGIVAAGLVVAATGVILWARRDRAVDSVKVELVATPPSAPLDRGPITDGAVVGALGLHQQAGTPLQAIWCAPRQMAIIAYRRGDVLALDRQHRLAKLGSVGTPDNTRAALACAADGRIVGTIGDRGFVVVGDRFERTEGAPPKAIQAVVVGSSIRWLAGDAIYEWNGDGPAREIRRIGCKGRVLAPDGNRVACSTSSEVSVDDGSRIIEGPQGFAGRWSETSAALYVEVKSLGWQRWEIGGGGRMLGTGTTAFDLNAKAVVVQPQAIVAIDAHGARSESPPVPPGATVLAAIPEHDELVLAAATDVWITAFDHIVLPGPEIRHVAPPKALAFSPDGTRIASLAADKLVIRALDGSGVEEVASDKLPSFSRLVWRDDGSLVVLATRRLALVRGDGAFHGVEADFAVDEQTGGIVASDGTAVRRVGSAGALADSLGDVPFLHAHERFELHGSRVLVRPADSEPPRLYDLAARRIERELEYRGRRRILEGAPLAGSRPGAVFLVEDMHVLVLDDARIIDLGTWKLQSPRPSPVARQVALIADREVVVYDVDRGAFVLRGELRTPVAAIAWSRDGRLAAIGVNGETRVWTPR